jgi:hypothetical protein
MLKNIEFPSRPDFKDSAYVPLYAEPTLGSGEHICVGIIVKVGDETRVVISDQLHRLTFLYQAPISGFLYFVDSTAASLRRYLSTHDLSELAGWESHLGFSVGPIRVLQAVDIEGLAHVAFMKHSVLYRHRDPDSSASAKNGDALA